MRRLLVLGLGGLDAAAVVETAVALGHEVYCVTSADRPPDDDPVWKSVTGAIVVDFGRGDVEAEIVAYAAALRIDGVFTNNEFLTSVSARVSARLGLPGNDPALADAPRNKVVMSERFAAHGVVAPRTVVVDTESELLRSVPGRLPLPVVVKPAANAGSRGVGVVTRHADLLPAFAAARAQGGEPAPQGIALDRRVLIQEYVDGQEYSIESVTQGGRSTHVCVTRKLTTPGAHRVEIGHSLPTRLEPAVERRVLDEVSRALAALGVTDSVSHTEVKVTPAGSVWVIEVGARVGAGRIGALIELALGVSMPRASIDLAFGDPVRIGSDRTDRTAHAVTRLFATPAAGRLVGVENLPEPGGDVHAVHITRPVGSMVAGPESNKGRVGYFVVRGTDDEDTNRRADELLDRVRVIVDATAGSR